MNEVLAAALTSTTTKGLLRAIQAQRGLNGWDEDPAPPRMVAEARALAERVRLLEAQLEQIRSESDALVEARRREIESELRLADHSTPLTHTSGADDGPAYGESRVLRFAAQLLPRSEREDWLEEHRGYLADLAERRARIGWVWGLVRGLPAQIVALRFGTRSRKESA